MSEGARRLVRGARLLALALALAVALLAVMALRTAMAGQEALAASERAFDSGDLRESVRYAARAATLSVPSAGYVDLAYRRLLVIARGAEAAGRPHLAAFAWNAIRGAAIESSAPGFGPRPELEMANQNLARLASQLANGGKEDPAGERELLKTLERPAGPAPDGLLLLGGGMLLLVLGLGLTGFAGLGADGRANARKLAVAALLVALGAACWTAAVYRA